MKIFLNIVAILAVLFMLSACNKDNKDADRLEFYILRHVEGTSDFVKDEKPIFTGKDILSYEWDTLIPGAMGCKYKSFLKNM